MDPQGVHQVSRRTCRSAVEVDTPLIGYFPGTPRPDVGIKPDVQVSDSVADMGSGVDPGTATVMQLLCRNARPRGRRRVAAQVACA